MNKFNDKDPTPPNLELSQDELEGLYRQLALIIVTKVTKYHAVTHVPGVYPVDDSSPIPKFFKLSVPAPVAEEIFYSIDDECTVSGGEISFSEPHRIEDIEDSGSISHVCLILKTSLPGAIHRSEFFDIANKDGVYDGTSDTEYTTGRGENERRISPNDIPLGQLSDHDIDPLKLIDDVFALENPLNIDDAEKLRKLADYIEAAQL